MPRADRSRKGNITIEVCLVSDKWSYGTGAWVRGCAFLDNQCKSSMELCRHFEKAVSKSSFAAALKDLNGFFAVIVKRENALFVGVDRVRSIPLFYSWAEDCLLVSDDPKWIDARLNKRQFDAASVGEFLLAGYVTGRYTLHPQIYQLQAGEYLIVDFSGRRCRLDSDRYYRFEPSDSSVESKSALLHKLDEVVLASVKRLIAVADGRPVVVPLSGGLDSRLIAMSLKRLGCRSVIAFSYGRNANDEARVSETIAVQLGIPWHFVEYSEELWRLWYESQECQQYISFAEGLSSVAHLQDWPAVMELKRRGVLPNGALIVPGHTGDFISGGHIPQEFLHFRAFNLQKVVRAIWRHHYILATPGMASRYAGLKPAVLREYLIQRIVEGIESVRIRTLDDAVRACCLWEWQERQAKFIVNSVRVYDFWKYEWWLPWWDLEVLEYWSRMPLVYRLNRRLYREYVASLQHRLGVAAEQGLTILKKGASRLFINDMLERLRLFSAARWFFWISIKKYIRSKDLERYYATHPLAWYGITDLSRCKKLLWARGDVNTIIAMDQLKWKAGRLRASKVDA